MWEAAAAVAGLIVGGTIAWVLATNRARLAAVRKQSELQSNLAAADSRASEIREQLAEREATLATLREQFDNEHEERTRAETRLLESTKRLEEQQRLLEQAEKRLKESFEALSAAALKANAEQFLQSAKRTLELILTDARGDLGNVCPALAADIALPVAV